MTHPTLNPAGKLSPRHRGNNCPSMYETNANSGTPGSPTLLTHPHTPTRSCRPGPPLGGARAPRQPDSEPCCLQDLLYVRVALYPTFGLYLCID